jgi:Carboxypeptidase regulatory-like domain
MHRLAVCVVLAFISFPGVVAAQGDPAGRTRGVVVDSAGQPLESVEASATTIGRVARTDTDGRFTLAGLLAGPNRLLVRRVGWKTVDTTITVDSKSSTQAWIRARSQLR